MPCYKISIPGFCGRFSFKDAREVPLPTTPGDPKQRLPKTPEALLTHNCLTYASAAHPAGWWCFPGVNRNAPLPAHATFKTDDTEALLVSAVAGIGIVHLASWMVHDKLVAGELVELFPGAKAMPSPRASAIYTVRMPGRSHAAKAQLFISQLKAHIGDPPYLSPELVKLAHERGYGESSRVVWRHLQGKKDWELKPFILDGDWTFVTRNSVDFRGPSPPSGIARTICRRRDSRWTGLFQRTGWDGS